MAKVLQVRGVPDAVHETLAHHAEEEEALSLNRYMLPDRNIWLDAWTTRRSCVVRRGDLDVG